MMSGSWNTAQPDGNGWLKSPLAIISAPAPGPIVSVAVAEFAKLTGFVTRTQYAVETASGGVR